MTNLSLMSIVQLSHDLSMLSLGPVHRACHAVSYGNVTVEKCLIQGLQGNWNILVG